MCSCFATHPSRNRTVGVAFVLYPKNVPESKQPAHALALGVPLLRVLRASGLLIFRYVPLNTHSLCYVVQRKRRRKDRHRMQNVESSSWADLELKSEKKTVRTEVSRIEAKQLAGCLLRQTPLEGLRNGNLCRRLDFKMQ